MIQSKALKEGDMIGIIAPAGRIDYKEIEKAAGFISQNWKMKVHIDPQVQEKYHQFAGTDQQRISAMQAMINNPEIKAILCARGGYGCVRIVDHIDFSPLLNEPKWIIGYSDITVFHNHLSKLGIQSLHATMPRNFPDGTESLFQAITGTLKSYSLPPHPDNIFGSAKAVLTGGNLSVLCSLSGSVSDLDTRRKILFIEDLNEHLYHLDRMMHQLRRSGKLDAIHGLIAGGFSDMKDYDTDFGKRVEEIILEALPNKEIPVCFDFPAGHISDNRALIMGSEVQFVVNEKGTSLEFL